MMNKKTTLFFATVFIVLLSSFGAHKFYVSIYQIDFVPEKKRVEITARIFMDDLNAALEQEFKIKTTLGEKSETIQDVAVLKKYLAKHIRVSIDGKEKQVVFLSKEIDNNVVIVYLKITDIKKINSFKIQNNALLDLYSDQQNIIQTNFYNNKNNYIFTGDYYVENITISRN
ncbi:DUF6702 family protein [Flavobacterium antarcticum]|uniref:DUF6702 family protein n=1 Tax=Flavobacterium antarcticum TaxID=271155 RepID=UPI0003B56139|nr:DUF6702 family protein [Flavobacterium antarcticum]